MPVLTPRNLTFAAMLALTACADDAMHAADNDARAPLAQGAQTEQTDASVVKREALTVGTFTFDVLTAGPASGPTVILLHGFPQNATEWAAQIPALAKAGYRVIAPNQRGYSPGARPAEVAAYITPNLVRDVLGIADAAGAKRFHLVGHDWGASVAWAVAGAAPERLLSVTPISVPHPLAFAKVLADPTSCQPQSSSYFARLIAPNAEQSLLANNGAGLRLIYGDLPRATADAYVKFFDQPTLTGALNWYRANLGARAGATPATQAAQADAPRAASGLTTVPTLYVWSDRDTALCRDGAVLTKDYVTGPYQFEIIEGVSHWVPELAAERLNTVLLAHLAKFDAKP
ncbi:MAG: alpha/beta hydrolase [Polyangiales bacterium]